MSVGSVGERVESVGLEEEGLVSWVGSVGEGVASVNIEEEGLVLSVGSVEERVGAEGAEFVDVDCPV